MILKNYEKEFVFNSDLTHILIYKNVRAFYNVSISVFFDQLQTTVGS